MGYQLILHKILIERKKIGHSNQYFFHDQCVIKENNDVAECLHRKKKYVKWFSLIEALSGCRL